MRETFDTVWPLLMASEGGSTFTDHPKDAGGPTKFGVTQRVYDGWRDSREMTRRSVHELEEPEAKFIARSQYWDKVRGNELPTGIDYMMFDTAYLCGPGVAIRLLQILLGVKQDGIFGNVTMSALKNDRRSTEGLISAYAALRQKYLASRKGSTIWQAGWSNRTKRVMRDAIALQLAEPLKQTNAPMPASAKVPQASGVTQGRTGKASIIATVGVAGTAVAEAAKTIKPLAEIAPWFNYLFAAMTVVGVGLTLYFTIQRYSNDGAEIPQ